MQRRTAYVIAALGAAVCMLPLTISGCPVTPGGGGGGGEVFNRDPEPVIASDVVSGVAPLTVLFNSDRSTDDGLIIARNWDFGDGSTSAQIAPQHTFASNGDYTVTLTLTDDKAASASTTANISVTDAPVAVIAYSPTTVQAAPAEISYDASDSFDDSAVISYSWDFGDGSRSSLVAGEHVYAASGMYEVQLTVTDDKGVTGTSAVMIEVGIQTPTIEVRVPPSHVKNIVAAPDSPVWIQAVFNIELGANRFTHAGLDRDQDLCDSQAVMFGAITGASIHTLLGHDDLLNDVAFSTDGALIATASDDGTVRIYNVATGVLARSIAGAGQINTVTFSPDEETIAWGQSDGDIVLAEIASGAVVHTLASHTDGVNDLAFSPDGSELMSGSDDRRAILWRASDGTILRDWDHAAEVNAVAISPFDPTMVASSGEDPEIKVWNTISGTALTTYTVHDEAVNSMVFSYAGMAIYSGSDDNTAKASSPFFGTTLMTYEGHDGNVTSVAISPDGARLLTGSTDDTARVWMAGTAVVERTLEPCESDISAVAISPSGARYATAVAAYNDIPLTTDPSEGDDYNITFPRELSLKSAPSLGLQDVPPGDYYLWVEIDSVLAPSAVRAYANAKVNVVDDFATTIGGSPPELPLVEGEASVAVPTTPGHDRQIFDLGELSAGDKIYFSLMSLPAFGQFYEPETEYSIMLLDADQEIVAWYQALERPLSGVVPTPEFYKFVAFNAETETVLGHDSLHHYVVVDGDVNVHVRVEQTTDGAPPPRQQVVYVRFDGETGLVSVGGQTAVSVPAFDAANITSGNPDTPDVPGWGGGDTTTIKNGVMAKLNEVYADFDVVFTSSDDGPEPATPFITLWVGGYCSGDEWLGAFDEVDPRNQTLYGRAIVYAYTVARKGVDHEFPSQPSDPTTDTPTDAGRLCGVVAAHEVGHLLGLRNTNKNKDIMKGLAVFDVANPNKLEELKSGSPSSSELVSGGSEITVIGTQDARQLLEETVGLAPPP